MLEQNLPADQANWLRFKITHADLTEATANTAQAIDLCPVVAGDVVLDVLYHMPTAFQDASDAAFNSTTLSLGDGASATALQAAKELNVNGTEILTARTATGKAYPTADTLKATFGSMADKSLSNIDAGEVHIFVLLFSAAKKVA